MILKTLRVVSIAITILFVLFMWNFDYDKIDCYLHADNQSDCTTQNSYKYKGKQ